MLYLGPWVHIFVDLGVGHYGSAPNFGGREGAACPSAVDRKSTGAEELVEEEASDRFGRLVFKEVEIFESELFRHRVGHLLDVIGHFSKSPDDRPDCPFLNLCRRR